MPDQAAGWQEDEVKERCTAARRRKVDAEKALLDAAKELASASQALIEAETALSRERKAAPLRHWTKAANVSDRFQYIRQGYALVREIASIDNKRPWRVQKGKGFITDRFGRVASYSSVEAAAMAANELIENL